MASQIYTLVLKSIRSLSSCDRRLSTLAGDPYPSSACDDGCGLANAASSYIIHGVERPGKGKMANVDQGVRVWWTSGQALGLIWVIRSLGFWVLRAVLKAPVKRHNILLCRRRNKTVFQG